METILLIVLLVHVIALLGLVGTARHDAMPLDGYGEAVPDWFEYSVPAAVAVPEPELAVRH